MQNETFYDFRIPNGSGPLLLETLENAELSHELDEWKYLLGLAYNYHVTEMANDHTEYHMTISHKARKDLLEFIELVLVGPILEAGTYDKLKADVLDVLAAAPIYTP